MQNKENEAMKYINMLQSVQLKVKAKSLADEARVIRKEERKMLKHHQHGYHAGSDCFIWEPGANCGWYSNLRHHRVWDVRQEARATQIARTFLAGKSYESIEPHVTDCYAQEKALDRAAVIVFKYGNTQLKAKYQMEFNSVKETSPGFQDNAKYKQWAANEKRRRRQKEIEIVRKWANFNEWWYMQVNPSEEK